MASDPRDELIADLRAQVASLSARIEELTAVVAKLAHTSRNSSKPPSQDPPGTTRSPKLPTGRRRGGQPGHKGSRRELLPAEQVTHVVDHDPSRCGSCDASLGGGPRVGEPERHQVIDLPPIEPVVVEHRCHAKHCAGCGATTTAGLPADVPRTTFGPTVACFVAVMTAKYQLSKRNVQEMLSDFLGIELSLGEVSNLEQRVSLALEAPYREAHAAIQHAQLAWADETGWRQDKERAWLWLATSPLLAVFRIDRNRGGPAARALLGEDFSGILSSDRWSAYTWVDVERRQLCWAHLIRNSQGVVDRGGAGARFGQAMLNFAKRMMRWWHALKAGKITRAVLVRRMEGHRRDVAKVLAWGAELDGRAAAMAKDLAKLEPAMWTFAIREGVEPTNNLAERDLRAAVIWRKTSFGTDSERGSRFVERMLSVVASLRKQGRSILAFLDDALAATSSVRPAPSLLPRQA